MKNPIVLGALALALLAGPALASDRGQPQTAPKLSVGEIDARVRENGYASVRSIELRRDGSYSVKAVDASGRRAEFAVDGNTGEFLQKGSRHGRDDDYDGDNDARHGDAGHRDAGRRHAHR